MFDKDRKEGGGVTQLKRWCNSCYSTKCKNNDTLHVLSSPGMSRRHLSLLLRKQAPLNKWLIKTLVSSTSVLYWGALPCLCAPVLPFTGGQGEVGVQTPLNLTTIITRDWIGIDLFLALSFPLRHLRLLPFPQGHLRVRALVKAVTLDSPLHLPPPLLPWQWTALALRGLCEGAEGASGWMNAAASFPNLGQPCGASVSDGSGWMLAMQLEDKRRQDEI